MKTLGMLALGLIIFTSCVKEPEACFDIPKSQVEVYEHVQFNNCSESTEYYTWYFGNGGATTVEAPSYQYTQSGQYKVTLICSSKNQKKTSETSEYITVYGPSKRYTGSYSAQEDINYTYLGNYYANTYYSNIYILEKDDYKLYLKGLVNGRAEDMEAKINLTDYGKITFNGTVDDIINPDISYSIFGDGKLQGNMLTLEYDAYEKENGQSTGIKYNCEVVGNKY